MKLWDRFRDIPIRRKLTVIAMLTTGAALAISSLVLIVRDAMTFRDGLQRDLSTVGSIIANNSNATLSFQDPTAAAETLSAVRAKPNITSACIYDESERIFASYARLGQQNTCPLRPTPEMAGFRTGRLIVYQPVTLGEKKIGMIYLESTMEEFTGRLYLQILTFGIVLMVAGFVAFLISSRLQRLISSPVMSLVRIADSVSKTKDFSLRAAKETTDEVGQLVDAFNKMLSEISLRDALMATARSEAEFLAEVSRISGSSLDARTTLSSVARLAVPAMGDLCVIDTIQNARIERQAAYAEGLQDRRLELLKQFRQDAGSSGAAATVIRTGKPLPGVAIDADSTVLRELDLKSFLTLPLISGGRILGSIGFASSQPDRYGEHDLRLGEQLADRTAVALDNAGLYSEVQISNRMKDEFLATMSHELRTPLTAIVGWSRLLKSGKLPLEKSQQAIEVIDRSAELESRLVDDILDASRIIAGKLKLAFDLIDIVEVLNETVHLVRPAAESKGLRLVTSFETIPRVWANTERLQQVFSNLLSNAVKFTPSGGTVSVSARAADSYAEIKVTDTGIGISPDFLPYVFERFRQADASSTRKHGGLGLGLAIVRHLMELHGGNVLAESPGVGKGATFTVRIPLAEREQMKTAPSRWPVQTMAADLEGMRVLVVEDDENTRELMVETLEQYGAEVQGADSYHTALKTLEKFTPDVFLIDIGMPEHDGYALIATIRSMPNVEQVPAIAVTAYATEMDRKAALAAGFQEHVAKPFRPDNLVQVIADTAKRDMI